MRPIPSLCVLLVFVLMVPLARAQAWLPDQGEASVGLQYAYFNGGDHIFPDDSIDGLVTRGYEAEGNRWYLGEESNHAITGHFDLGIVDWLAVSGGLTWVASKYDGLAPWDLDLDNGEFQTTLQDASLQLRGLAWDGPIRVTPFLGYQFPVSDYETIGHAAPGRHLQTWTLGVSLARSLSPWLRNTYVEWRYGYALDEENQGYDLNRHAFDLQLGYQLTRRIQLRTMGNFVTTGGGLAWVGSSGENVHEGGSSSQGELDATVSDIRYWRWGLGASVKISRAWSLHANYVSILTGKNTLDGDFFSTGINFDFRTPWAPRRMWI